jgi:predicted  nucleic acid-binding Zn-ribbon protein
LCCRLAAVSDSLHRLLDLQDRDVHIDQLRHRRANLPEQAALTANEKTLAALEAERTGVAERLAELERSQKRLEDEITTITEKQSAENLKLYGGSITSPKELQALQDEIANLGTRQRQLEDQELDLMEQAEPVQAELAGIDERSAALIAEIDALRGAVAEVGADVDAELAAELGVRDDIAGQIPADMLATYDKLRTRLGGVAVARLEGSQCLGCHLSLPATEVDAIRHADPDAVVTHEECGRILVR